MAVRIRLKKMGRRHRPYYRICVMDSRTPRDGKTIEEVGTYDPMVPNKDDRCTMIADRIDYWLGVGALPTEKVKILIGKYKGKVPEKRVDAARPRMAPPPKPILAAPKRHESDMEQNAGDAADAEAAAAQPGDETSAEPAQE